jgi:hypothetical protein
VAFVVIILLVLARIFSMVLFIFPIRFVRISLNFDVGRLHREFGGKPFGSLPPAVIRVVIDLSLIIEIDPGGGVIPVVIAGASPRDGNPGAGGQEEGTGKNDESGDEDAFHGWSFVKCGATQRGYVRV